METLDDLFRRLEQLNDIGASLSNERDLDRLLEKILLAAKAITRADGGTLYLVSEDQQRLHFQIVRTDSLSIAFGGSSGQPTSGKFPDLALYNAAGEPNNTMVAVYAAITGKTVNIADAYTAEGFDFSGTRKFDERTGYRSRSFLTVPMQNHEGEIIGVLQLINALDANNQVEPFNTADQRLAESLASQAAIALTNRQLVQQLEELFEAFIKLINLAIDEKSPYTGGHCQRVPALTMMLAEAVNATTSGPLADFKLTEKDRYELRIAALLHDCGKVTTPEWVMDKATKLQSINDRIDLIATRFEVFRRDAEIAHLRGNLDAEGFAAAGVELDETLAFLRRTNMGGEFLRPEDQVRVRTLASRTWTRADGSLQPWLTPDEVENLCIPKGTLLPQEREIINHHMVATIKMLEKLPFPKHLKRVPEYAGGHHERMDGKGYPRGLTRDQMSVQARIMGIADVFEALTAGDRPYKKAMPLSQALAILGRMAETGHIDPDLFQIFMDAGVYRIYAERFLTPDQRDVVDLTQIPGYRP